MKLTNNHTALRSCIGTVGRAMTIKNGLLVNESGMKIRQGFEITNFPKKRGHTDVRPLNPYGNFPFQGLGVKYSNRTFHVKGKGTG